MKSRRLGYSSDLYLPCLIALVTSCTNTCYNCLSFVILNCDIAHLPANHLQEADSVIEYNPANNSFELSLGRKCLVKEGERAQACISYGIRKDSELLLNYGFLRGVSMDRSTDDVRQRLALEYLKRNP